MAVVLKSEREIAALRDAGRIVAETYLYLEPYIVPGVSTLELDRRAEEFIRKQRAVPTYKGYAPGRHTPFPATICVAPNNIIVHGIPRRDQILRDGDIVGIDIGATYKGWIGDACRTFTVGAVDAAAQRLVEVTRDALRLALQEVRPGAHLGDIGAVIQARAEPEGFSVVRELCGHGVGRALWEEPSVFHHGRRGTGLTLRPGMVFTIEPMINAGRPEIQVLPDGWTIATRDGSLSAQFEETLVVTPDGYEILTKVDGVS